MAEWKKSFDAERIRILPWVLNVQLMGMSGIPKFQTLKPQTQLMGGVLDVEVYVEKNIVGHMALESRV